MRRALAVLMIACACSGGSRHPSGKVQALVRTQAVKRGDVIDRLLLAGTLHAIASAELSAPRVQGVWELPVRWLAEDGAAVKAGERAVEFDSSAFVSTLAEKRLRYIDARMAFDTFLEVSSLDEAKKSFEVDSAKLVLAKANVLASVPADLLDARTAQERQLELRRGEAAVARADKELASVRSANAFAKQVKQIELDATKQTILDAERAIGELVLEAPRDGTIVVEDHPWRGRRFEIGDTAPPGCTIVTLPDPASGMDVRAELSDVDDGRVSIGMQGTCTVDAYPGDPLPCTVKDLMPVASGKAGSSLRRSFALVVTLAKLGNESLRPGMSVKIELRRPPLANVLVVPRGAVHFDKDRTRVKLASGEQREVELGPCDAQACAVTNGLREGLVVAW